MLRQNLVLSAIFLILLRCILALNDYGPKQQQQQQQQHRQQVLLLSFDGFRWDYLGDAFITKFNLKLPNFDRLKKIGIYSPLGNIPPYVTETFPSHYTTATGLYIENHGIVGNTFYEPKLKKQFKKWFKEPRWWNQGEPIWITAKKQNLRSGVFFWPGSGVPIDGISPDLERSYDESVPFHTRVHTVIEWLRDGVDLVCAYFHEPDKTGHEFGPDSPEAAAAVKRMDGVIGTIIEQVQSKDLKDKVNVLLTSDHGMYSISRDKTISLCDHINMDDADVTVDGEFVHIFPTKLSLDETFDIVAGISPHLRFYRRRDIPASFHYSTNDRVAPIVGFADLGWLALKNVSDMDWSNHKGSHGWANTFQQMRPIFFAFGPAFKGGMTTPSFETVDYYALICNLLNLTPAPNNGTLKVFEKVLRNGDWATNGFRYGRKRSFNDSIIKLLVFVMWICFYTSSYKFCAIN